MISAFWLSILIPQSIGLPADAGELVGVGIASAVVVVDFSHHPTRFARISISHLAAAAAGALFAPVVGSATVAIGDVIDLARPDRTMPIEPPEMSAFFAAVALSPVVEEYVFRGRVLSTLKERLGTAGAVLLSSALFASIHMNAWLAIGAFGSGLVLASLTIGTRGISHSVVFHCGLNSCALLGGSVASFPLSQIAVLAGSSGAILAAVVLWSRQPTRTDG